MKTTKAIKRGFTLVELLVVITIIGILAGLAIPGVTGVLDRAKQMKDVSNAKQVGLILFVVANDENGKYPIGAMNSDGTARTQAGSSLLFWRAMLQEGALTDAKVLATNGTDPFTGSVSTLTGFAINNIGWDYATGLTTSNSPNIPLITSFGIYGDVGDFSSPQAAPASSAWGDKGVVVYTIGQSALFVKSYSNAGVKNIKALVDDDDVSGLTTTYLKGGKS